MSGLSAGGLTSVVYPNGITKSITYTDSGRVESINFVKSGYNLYGVSYWYDSAGRRIRRDVTLPGDPPVTDRYDYTYDTLDQLLEVKKNSVVVESFSYDLAKNRTYSGAVGYSYDSGDRMLTAGDFSFNYDPCGNRTKKTDGSDETDYFFNSAGLLKKIVFPDGSEVRYDYDHTGMRDSERRRNGDVYRHYWWSVAPGGLPHVLTSVKAGAVDEFTNYVYGAGLLAREVNQADGEPVFTYFLVGDNENVVALADDNGDVTDRYEYSAFGTLQSHTGSDSNRIMFSSEPNDEDSGLIYLRHRYYEPDCGRFVSKDPKYSYRENLFVYCNNNPVYYVDHSGNDCALGVTSYAVWRNTHDQLRPKWRSKYYKTIDTAVGNLIDMMIAKSSNPKQERGKYTCSHWGSDFIHELNYNNFSPKTGKMLIRISKENLDNWKYLIDNTGAFTVTPYRVSNTPTGPKKPNHDWIYLKFVFPDGEVVWWFTESNYEGHKYNSYQVLPPQSISPYPFKMTIKYI